MATNTDQIVTQLVADTKKFDGAMNGSIEVIKRFNKAGEEIGSRVKVVTKHLEEASSKTNSFRDSMTRLSRDIKVTNTIFDALAGSITKAYAAASEGSKIMAAEQFFKNAGKSIEEYRKATNGMVSDAELMKKANLADSMGIDEKTFKQLVMVAEASALKTGQSFDYMFNSIIVGTARSSRLLLDNLGIIVSVGQANDTYAAKIGKTVEALSAEEKQLAFVEEVARKSQGTLDEYAATTDRTAESFARFDATVQNLADTVSVKLAKGFATLLPEVTQVLRDLRMLFELENWQEVGRYIGSKILEGLTKALDKVTPGDLGWLSRAFGAQADLTVYEGKTQKQAERNFNLQETYTAKAEIEKMTSESLGSLIRRYQTMKTVGSEALDGLIADLLKFNKAADDVLGLMKDNFWNRPLADKPPAGRGKKGPKFTPDPFEPSREEQAMYGTGFKGKSLLEAIFEDTAKKMAEAAKNATDPLDFSEGLKEVIDYAAKWAEFEKNLFDEKKKAEEEAQKEALEATRRISEEWQRMTNDLVAGTVSGVASGSSLFGAIGAGVGPMVGAAVGGPLGAAIGALLPVIGQMIDKLAPVVDLIASIVDGLGLLIEHALSELLVGLPVLGVALQDLLAAVGLLIGSALRPFVTAVTTTLGVVSGIISAVALVLTAFSPFVELLAWFVSGFAATFFNLIGLFFDLNVVVGNLNAGFMWFLDTMLGSAIRFNNMIVKIARDVFGLKGFGKYLEKEDFRPDGNPIDENTSALDNNTQALRDFTREFRNLPQSYKAAGAIYGVQNAETQWRGGFRRPQGIGERSVDGFANGRWRT